MKANAKEFTHHNQVKLIPGGKPYFDCLLSMIREAKETIHIQTYIYDDDDTGRMIGEALKAAARNNVEVYLLVDGYASRVVSKRFVQDLRSAKVHFRFFDPLFKTPHFYLGRRLHHKIAVVDACRALVGGVNITNRYNDMPGKPAWLDFAVHIQGDGARELCIVCWKAWKNFLPYSWESLCHPGPTNTQQLSLVPCAVSLRRNDWVRRKNQISSTYVEMFRNARSHILILCSYFLPGSVIRKQLAYAASRGVRIKIITTAISDVRLLKQAERYMYGWILENNIELYEYQPRILHGKIAVCDGEWMTVGSYNINDVSTYASIELNVVVRNKAVALETERALVEIIQKDCRQINRESYMQTKNPVTRFVRWFSYHFIRLTIYFFTFYFKHHP